MARVTIDKGDLDARDQAKDVPIDQWPELIRMRKKHIQRTFVTDCVALVDFVSDCKDMYQELGYTSVPDMIKQAYGLDPDDAVACAEWIRKHEPSIPIGIEEVRAIVCAEARHQAKSVKPGNPTGSNQHQEKNGNHDNIMNSNAEQGTSQSYLLRRLARNHPEILDAYEQGEYPSVRQAAIAAGIVKTYTKDEQAVRAFAKCDNKLAVLKSIIESLEPHEWAFCVEIREQ